MVRNITGLLVMCLVLSVMGPLGAQEEMRAEPVAAAGSLNPVAAVAVNWLDEGQLVYRFSPSMRGEVGYVSGQYLHAAGKPASLRAEPTYGSKQPRYFVWAVNGEQRVLAVDESKGPGRGYDRLFVDQNGDGALTAGEQVPGVRRQGDLVFGPVRVSLKTDHGPRLYHFLVRSYAYSRNYPYLNLETACYYLGQVRLGDKPHKVALVDSNANGAFNDLSTSPWDGDRLLIDLNDDGQFAVNTGDDPETFPLSKLLQVEDGYVAVEAAPDGSSLAMSVPDLKLGQVQSDGAFQITLIAAPPLTPPSKGGAGGASPPLVKGGPGGVLRVKSDDGQAKVPVGEYRLYETSLTRKDDQGRRWELSSSSRGEMPTIKVAAGTTTELKLGSPLQARVSPRVSGRSVSFSLALTDAAGLDISNVTVNGQRPSAPKLRIKRADGKEVGRYDFQYG